MGAWIEIAIKVDAGATKESHPTMGAWIEIPGDVRRNREGQWSHPTMGAWIEIITYCGKMMLQKSHPTMGAWIEIFETASERFMTTVAPHDGCVD